MDKEQLRLQLERLQEIGIDELFYTPTGWSPSSAAEESQESEQSAVKPSEDSPLDEIARLVRACQNCPLSATRTNAVPGEGNHSARLVFIGEAPGGDEDRLGRPFVGRAGQLLDRMITALGLSRGQVYIGNVLKCRPPENRDPLPEEMKACAPYLDRQLDIIKPLVIVALGRFSAQYLMGSTVTIGRLRGQKGSRGNAVIIPTYHPAACLRFPEYKKYVWEDLQKAQQILNETKG